MLLGDKKEYSHSLWKKTYECAVALVPIDKEGGCQHMERSTYMTMTIRVVGMTKGNMLTRM
jgi:hypothetical protein